MSLEAALTALTEATNKLIELRTEAIEATKAAAASPASKGKTTAAKREITDAPEDRKETETETEAAEVEAEVDPLTRLIVEYCSADDAKERDARKAKVKEFMEKVGAKKRSEVPAAKVKPFINTMKKLIADGNLIPADEPEAEAEEEDSLID